MTSDDMISIVCDTLYFEIRNFATSETKFNRIIPSLWLEREKFWEFSLHNFHRSCEMECNIRYPCMLTHNDLYTVSSSNSMAVAVFDR